MSSLDITTVSTLVTAFTSIIAVIISLKTLAQNNKMIEEESKPYIVLYFDWISTNKTQNAFFVLKNFGKTGGKILELEYSLTTEELKNFYIDDYKNYPFENIKGSTLAPGQALYAYIAQDSLKKLPACFTVKIKYKGTEKIYIEEFEIRKNFNTGSLIPFDECDLSNILSEIARRL